MSFANSASTFAAESKGMGSEHNTEYLSDSLDFDKRHSLANQPAVRDRYELRRRRIEIGPALAFTLNRSFRHAVLFGLKLAFHFTDTLSIGATAGYGINFDTALSKRIEKSYEIADELPAWEGGGTDANGNAVEGLKSRFSDVQIAGDVRFAFAPFAGKLSMFSAIDLMYDFYVFGGFGFAFMSNSSDIKAVDNANAGFRPGAVVGLGSHIFLKNWLAFGFEFKDMLHTDNETGGDITRGLSNTEQQEPNNGQQIIDSDDSYFKNNFYVGVNLTLFVPKAKQSD